MTQKSHARKLRDAQASKDTDELAKFFQENTAWDDLNEVYNAIGISIAERAGAAVAAHKNPVVLANLEAAKFNEIQSLLAGLSSDVNVFVNEMITIRAAHLGKTGGTRNVEEFQLSVQVYEKYQELATRFEGVCGRTIQSLMEDAAAALTRGQEVIQAAGAQDPTLLTDLAEAIAETEPVSAAQDPNVVTDVEIKTTVKEEAI